MQFFAQVGREFPRVTVLLPLHLPVFLLKKFTDICARIVCQRNEKRNNVSSFFVLYS